MLVFLLLSRGDGGICSPLSHPSRGHQDGICLHDARNPAKPHPWMQWEMRAMLHKPLIPRGKSHGLRKTGGDRLAWPAPFPLAWSMPLQCLPSCVTKTNKKQMSNTTHYKWLKARQKHLKMESFWLILRNWCVEPSLQSF